tara:strand:+ start:14821 stop:15081 length:261 start_codon:yes stop_codon:yes gene_type:complete
LISCEQVIILSLWLKITHGMKRWIINGLIWGILMFVITSCIMPLLKNEELQARELLISTPVWLLGGLTYGYTTKQPSASKPDEKRT